MGKIIDLTGQKFGKLTVIEKSDKKDTNKQHAYWLCLCECGNKVIVNSNSLRSGNTRSCGCLRKPPNNLIDLTDLNTEKENNTVTFKVEGRLDTTTAPVLEKMINDECETVEGLILDLENLAYCIMHSCLRNSIKMPMKLLKS